MGVLGKGAKGWSGIRVEQSSPHFLDTEDLRLAMKCQGYNQR
jgi:hypothetical protein